MKIAFGIEKGKIGVMFNNKTASVDVAGTAKAAAAKTKATSQASAGWLASKLQKYASS